ncbi:MAG: glutamate racemase [Planctomycetes bacterium]|nr:glutamate racemase [Planctomycetota bacterium]
MSGPLCIFDSGVGGFSILGELQHELPHENILYLADQHHVPYGERSLDEIRGYAKAITEYFLYRDAKLIIIACNTASAAALHEMRKIFPDTPFVGMEPAVKPAAEETRTRKVGVIATSATFQGKLYESVVERFAEGVEVFRQPCPGLVEMIEEKSTSADEICRKLGEWINPMKKKGIDRLVLGCTHYPLIKDLIERVAGDGIKVIDPSKAVAKQAARLLASQKNPGGTERGNLKCLTTGNAERFAEQVNRFAPGADEIGRIIWNKEKGRLRLSE